MQNLALVAAQAHSTKADRAVVISARNFIRALGGSVGLAISSAIFSNSLHAHLPSRLPSDLASQLKDSVFATPKLVDLDPSTRADILQAYASASRGVFTMWVAVIGCCLVLMVFVKDKGLQRQEEKTTQQNDIGVSETNANEEQVSGNESAGHVKA